MKGINCRMIFYYDGILSGKTSLNSTQDEGIMFFSKAIQERSSVKKCLYQDMDKLDFKAHHILAEKHNKLIGYSRILEKGNLYSNYSSIVLIVQVKFINQQLIRVISLFEPASS